jgi:hypothetical protein
VQASSIKAGDLIVADEGTFEVASTEVVEGITTIYFID